LVPFIGPILISALLKPELTSGIGYFGLIRKGNPMFFLQRLLAKWERQ